LLRAFCSFVVSQDAAFHSCTMCARNRNHLLVCYMSTTLSVSAPASPVPRLQSYPVTWVPASPHPPRGRSPARLPTSAAVPPTDPRQGRRGAAAFYGRALRLSPSLQGTWREEAWRGARRLRSRPVGEGLCVSLPRHLLTSFSR